MRTPLTLLLSLLVSLVAFTQDHLTSTQPQITSDAESTAVQAISAFSRSPIASVQLSGTARAIVGSTNESGTFNFELKQNGESTLRLETGLLSRTETTGAFGDDPSCSWTGSDGVEHKTATHNCWLSLDWVLPSFALQSRHAALDKQLRSDKNAQKEPNQPLEFSRTVSRAKGATQERLRKLSTVSLLLDPVTALPSSLSFNLHPEDDAGTNIPIVVRYSDYRQVSGGSIPFHIQKYLNNGLVLDLRLENATIQ